MTWQETAFSRRLAIAICLLGITVGSSRAVGGPLSTAVNAFNNGFGPDAGAWRGTVAIAGAAFGDTLTTEVDWAVFAPGGFQAYLNSQAIAQVDPSGPNELTYVYQITSVTAASPGIDTLTVSVDPPDTRGIVLAPSFVLTGAANEKSPASGGDNTTSMAWFFDGVEPQVGDSSSLLVFTSPNTPEYDFIQVNSGLAGPVVSPLVASPGRLLYVPEPASLLLVAILGLSVAVRRKRNKSIGGGSQDR